jgi:hypothetical protein
MYINGWPHKTCVKTMDCIVVFSFDHLDFSVIYSSEGQRLTRAGFFGRACIDVIMVKFTLKV